MTSPEPKRCLDCGYILEGLPENRCPECGRAFDPDDPRTVAPPPESGRFLLLGAVIGAALVLGAFLIAVVVFAAEPRVPIDPSLAWGAAFLALVLFVFGLLLEFAMLVLGVRFFCRASERVKHRAAAVLAMLLAASVFASVLGSMLM
jgi:hypothetical protein